jgi:hypothetical protein
MYFFYHKFARLKRGVKYIKTHKGIILIDFIILHKEQVLMLFTFSSLSLILFVIDQEELFFDILEGIRHGLTGERLYALSQFLAFALNFGFILFFYGLLGEIGEKYCKYFLVIVYSPLFLLAIILTKIELELRK